MAEPETKANALPSDKKVYSLADCEKHTAEEDCWLVIHGKVYNVTEMLDEHPGGGDILVSASGRDATDDFEDVGHSGSAREWLEKYYIGEFEGGDVSADKKAKRAAAVSGGSDSSTMKLLKALLPLLVIAIALLAKLLSSPAAEK
mmetsp:Transcript_14188/g.40212  ORF Transcript_14188/g.40212 Transcript_14188/m.40212 type:complete len:145 (-) Transcript_14188:160-594(-)|eukprot:CAMPEP_0117671566 /NCGR_PEP_ID=MMETSP0804-20121206/13405_1 /TAXON_ID=1074897 /ORGANISM="Tetraselmis astigmatica, Strain CCMP880" /LENGTH=144 /DNA_ID=CAMNT_0005480041 /DNA_START=360 /DNA_END=794 /DNA_ORIENTATION=+